MGSFSCSIPPSFVLSRNMSTINTTSNWLRFGAFLSPPVPSLRIHWPLTTGHWPLLSCHWPLFFRSTPTRPDQRAQAVHRPSPAGYCHPPTTELGKTERDPISTSGPSLSVCHRSSVCYRTRQFLRSNPSVSHRSPPPNR